MSAVGDDPESDITLAQNVDLVVSNTATALDAAATAAQAGVELRMMRDIRWEKTHPETRIDHGTDRTYGHAAPDIGMSFIVTGTAGSNDRDLATFLRTRNMLDARNVLPTYTWGFQVTSNDNQTKTIVLKGKLRDRFVIRPDDPSAPLDYECYIRFTDKLEVLS